jgi:hypothetical protein
MADNKYIDKLLKKYPWLRAAIGWTSAASVLAGSLAGALGHVLPIKRSLFELVGPESLTTIHVTMESFIWVLFTVGYALAAVWLYRRHLSRPNTQLKRGLYTVTLAAGFIALTIVSVKAAIPPAPNVKEILSAEVMKWQTDLLGLQNPDGGLRYSKFDQTVESHVWTNAQILVGILSGKTRLAVDRCAQIRKQFDFIEKVMIKDPSGEGWGYMEYATWGVSEINAWVALAYIYSLRSESRVLIWPERTDDTERNLSGVIRLITSRQMLDGGWAPMNRSDNPRFARSYSTLMSVWALVEARQLTGSRENDEFIKRGINWLVLHYDEKIGGWVPNPDRKKQLDSFPGLTAHVLFVLTKAKPDFDSLLKGSEYENALSAFAKWLDGRALPLQKETFLNRSIRSNDRTHDSDRYLPRSPNMVEQSTFLWYPWTVGLCAVLRERDVVTRTRPAETWTRCEPINARVNELIKFANDDPFAYVTAESLLAVNLLVAQLQESP